MITLEHVQEPCEYNTRNQFKLASVQAASKPASKPASCQPAGKPASAASQQARNMTMWSCAYLLVVLKCGYQRSQGMAECIRQTLLALGGSNGVVCRFVHGGCRSFRLLFILLGDTYTSTYYTARTMWGGGLSSETLPDAVGSNLSRVDFASGEQKHVPDMESSIVRNLSGFCSSILSLFRSPRLNHHV